MTALALVGRIILLGIERIIVKKIGKDNNSIAVTVLFFGLGSLFLLPFLPKAINSSDFNFLPYALLSSCIYSITFVLYVKALSIGDVSLVTPVTSFNVLFLFLLSVIFLHEDFTILKISGILLIFYGSSYLKPGANLYNSIKGILYEKSCQYMLASTLLLAIGRIIDKALSPGVAPILYSFTIYTSITIILSIYLLIKKGWQNVIHVFKEKPGTATLSGLINAYSYLLLLVALQDIEVSIAEPLTLLSTLLAVILGKYIFQEKIQHRVIASIIILLGSWLIFL